MISDPKFQKPPDLIYLLDDAGTLPLALYTFDAAEGGAATEPGLFEEALEAAAKGTQFYGITADFLDAFDIGGLADAFEAGG